MIKVTNFKLIWILQINNNNDPTSATKSRDWFETRRLNKIRIKENIKINEKARVYGPAELIHGWNFWSQK